MALLTLLTAVTACTPERDQSELFAPEFLDILVIDAVLIVDQEYPLIKLSRTLAPNVPFNPETAGETGAAITISFGPSGSFLSRCPRSTRTLSNQFRIHYPA